jgi:PPOX class probable F420-dependent enzyme
MTVHLSEDALTFVTDRHLATLSSYAKDGSIHTVPVGFTFDDGIVRIITSGTSQKVRNLRRNDHATVSQFEGARWLTLVGRATVESDPEVVADAVRRYSERYRQPRENPERVAIVIEVTAVLGSSHVVPR